MFHLSKKLILLAFGALVLVAIVLLAVFLSKGQAHVDPLLVATPNGLVRGKYVINSTTNATFWAWEGIPFGQPPVRNLRFQAPLPAKPWNGILEANQTATPCIPITHDYLDADPGITSEDCLYLNVYAPAKKFDEKLPVMIYILGGGFTSGAAIYDALGPDHLVENDVIVVTFNYRLAMLGFLSTGDEVIPGNAALKDQLLVLKWTNENIKYFGGDSKKVTLFGGSSGGMSVGLHYYNKNSAGLFRAALCSSGCSLNHGLFQNDPSTNAFQLARLIDPTISADLNTTEELRIFLQSVDVNLIITANKNLTVQTGTVLEVDNPDAFLSVSNFEAVTRLETGDFNQVPLLLGYNSEESLRRVGTTAEEIATEAKTYDDDVTKLVPIQSLNPLNSTNLTELGLTIKKTYVGDSNFETNIVQFLEFLSDDEFVRSHLRQAQLVSQFQPVYLYQFSYYGTVSKMTNTAVIEGAGKAGHAAEYPQVFKVAIFPLTLEEDIKISKKFARLWTNFAKYLNPTPDTTDSLLDNVTWPLVTPSTIQYMDIDTVLSVQPDRKIKEQTMWLELFKNYSQPPYQSF